MPQLFLSKEAQWAAALTLAGSWFNQDSFFMLLISLIIYSCKELGRFTWPKLLSVGCGTTEVLEWWAGSVVIQLPYKVLYKGHKCRMWNCHFVTEPEIRRRETFLWLTCFSWVCTFTLKCCVGCDSFPWILTYTFLSFLDHSSCISWLHTEDSPNGVWRHEWQAAILIPVYCSK